MEGEAMVSLRAAGGDLPGAPGVTTEGAEAILWLEPGETRLAVLPLAPPLGCLRTREALLVCGWLPAGASRRRLLGRPFLRSSRARVWVEVPAGTFRPGALGTEGPPSPPAPAPPPGHCLLVCLRTGSGSRLRTVPEPARWPPLAGEVHWGAPLPAPAYHESVPLPGWRLRLAPGPWIPGRDGLLWHEREAPGALAPLAGLGREPLTELLHGAAGPWRWLYAPRGVEGEFPGPGRPLANLGTPVEPVLVPSGRAPRPRLSSRQLRRILGAGEGEGILWFDAGGEERCVRFRRSALGRFGCEELLGELGRPGRRPE